MTRLKCKEWSKSWDRGSSLSPDVRVGCLRGLVGSQLGLALVVCGNFLVVPYQYLFGGSYAALLSLPPHSEHELFIHEGSMLFYLVLLPALFLLVQIGPDASVMSLSTSNSTGVTFILTGILGLAAGHLW